MKKLQCLRSKTAEKLNKEKSKGRIEMKKIITLIISFVLIVVSVVMSGSAEGQRVYNWYCVRKSGHLQPNCEPSMSFIEEYNGYYVDKKHNESSQDKVIYLTFDAGYENGNVTKILDI
jgi:peptidoglycan-N-acetylmuramic acid deacetylase